MCLEGRPHGQKDDALNPRTPERGINRPGPSATEPDWTREHKPFWAWDPSRSLLASVRSYQRHAGSRQPWDVLVRKVAVLRHRVWSIVTGADIPLNSHIGGGLLLPHPNGVVIHPEALIGPNCLIFQQVTLGGSNLGAPRLGGHVDIGAGAKILGPVVIADHALIGANAVVVCDVPAGATAVGVPARVLVAETEASASNAEAMSSALGVQADR